MIFPIQLDILFVIECWKCKYDITTTQPKQNRMLKVFSDILFFFFAAIKGAVVNISVLKNLNS